jgi:uncharacterized iron-regulated membrane protein
MRRVHRLLAVIAVFLGLYVGATGTFLQAIDLVTLLRHAPDSDANLRAIREGGDGPPNFQVRVDADYTAQPLPSGFDYRAAAATVARSARQTVGATSLNFIDLRMKDGRPIGQVDAGGYLLSFDAATGAVLVGPEAARKLKLPPGGGRPALRNTIKNIHRMTAYGDIGAAAFMLVALALCVMVVTGLVVYVRLLLARIRMDRRALFWSAGGWWRTGHRCVAIGASLFLTVVAASGALLAFNDVGVSFYRVTHHGQRPGMTADVSAPLTDAELGPMTDVTLAAFHAAYPNTPIKVLRLRHFAGMPQGLIVTGGKETRQRPFNAATGGVAPLWAPGYPITGQPFGWAWDQTVKGVHRGDAFGLPGRWMSLLTGLSLLFLCISGAANYYELWSKRRKAGRPGLLWS